MIAKRIISREYIKEIPNWEKQYLGMNIQLSKRQKELLEGAKIKSHEGMIYGAMSVSYTHLTLPTNREV